jgi:hypothetical protein
MAAGAPGVNADGIYFGEENYPNPFIEDAFLAITNTDIVKDQGNDYNLDIVKGILPKNSFSGILASTMAKVPGVNEAINNRVKSLREASDGDKDYLWNCIVLANDKRTNKPIIDDTYNFFNSLISVGDDGIIKINGTNFVYNYKVFERYSKGEKEASKAKAIGEFMREPFIKITDTSKGGHEMITNWPDNKLIHAHTREVEMDPATKMRPDAETASKFYYEDIVNNENPKFVEYPAYVPGGNNSELSYFFSSRPVVLIHHGVKGGKDYKKFKMIVDFQYTDEKNNEIILKDGDNIAGALTKQILKGLGKLTPEKYKTKLEGIFISKHHGDIAQVLTYKRNIRLTNFANNTKIYSTDNYTHVFESLDALPVLKAFLIGVDSVWFYPTVSPTVKGAKDTGNLVIIFKRLKSQSEIEAIEEEKQKILAKELTKKRNELNKLVNKLGSDIAEYNAKVGVINEKIRNFINSAKYHIQNSSRVVGDLATKYRNIIKSGLEVGILSSFLPKEYLQIIDINEIISISANINKADVTIDKLNIYHNKIIQIQSNLKIPKSYLDINVYDVLLDNINGINIYKLKDVKIAKSIVFEGTQNKYDDRMKIITLDESKLSGILPTSPITGSLTARFVSGWGMDLILTAYNRMLNNDLSNIFIGTLDSLFTKPQATDIQIQIYSIMKRPIVASIEVAKGGSRTPKNNNNPMPPLKTPSKKTQTRKYKSLTMKRNLSKQNKRQTKSMNHISGRKSKKQTQSKRRNYTSRLASKLFNSLKPILEQRNPSQINQQTVVSLEDPMSLRKTPLTANPLNYNTTENPGLTDYEELEFKIISTVITEIHDYFRFVYDILMEDETERIKERIYEWLRLMYPESLEINSKVVKGGAGTPKIINSDEIDLSGNDIGFFNNEISDYEYLLYMYENQLNKYKRYNFRALPRRIDEIDSLIEKILYVEENLDKIKLLAQKASKKATRPNAKKESVKGQSSIKKPSPFAPASRFAPSSYNKINSMSTEKIQDEISDKCPSIAAGGAGAESEYCQQLRKALRKKMSVE